MFDHVREELLQDTENDDLILILYMTMLAFDLKFAVFRFGKADVAQVPT